jgi:hypothetical protein
MLLSEEHLKLGTGDKVEQGTIGARFFALEVRMGKKYSHVPVLFSSCSNVSELDFYA